jgi:heptosyltransferase-2
LAGLLALLGRVRVLVSNDSGPLHMAALAGIPSVGLFGAESAAVYGPRGDKRINLDRELYCSPCLNVYNFKDFDCPYDLRCMREIVPREVLHAVRRLLGPRPETAAR